MKINKLSVNSFKGIDAEIELGDLNLIVGRNDSGKSAILQACMCACVGHGTGGKTEKETAKLGGPGGFSVTATLDDGFLWSRGIVVSPDGRAKNSILLDVDRGMGYEAARARLHEKIGSFAPVWDIRKFLDMSPEKMRSFLVNLYSRIGGAAGGQPRDLEADILHESAKNIFGAGKVEATLLHKFKVPQNERPSKDQIAKLINGQFSLEGRNLFWHAFALVRDCLQQDPLDAIASSTSEIGDLINKTKKEYTAADEAKTAIQERLNSISVPAGTARELEAKLNEKRTSQKQVLERISAARQRVEHIGTVENNISNIDRRLIEIRARVAELSDIPESQEIQQASERALAESADLEAKKKDTSAALTKADLRLAQLDNLRSNERSLIEMVGERPDVDALSQKYEAHFRATERITEFDQKISLLRERKAVVSVQLEAAVRDKASAEETDAVFRRLKVLAMNVTPTEDTKDRYDDLLKEISELSVGTDDAARRIEGSTKEKQDLSAEIEAKESMRSTIARDLDDEAESRLSRAQQLEVVRGRIEEIGDAEEIRREAKKADECVQGDLAALQKRSREIETMRDRRQERDRCENEIGTLAQRREEASKTLEDLRGQETATVDSLEADKKHLDSEIESLQKNLESKQKHDSLEQELLDLRVKVEDKQALHKMAKHIRDALSTSRETMMEELTGPLLKGMEVVISAYREGWKPYVELVTPVGNKSVMQYGIQMGDTRVPHDTLSGSATAAFMAAMAAAMVRVANPPLKILLIEAAELDSENLGHLLNALAAIRHSLSNILVATHLPVGQGPAELLVNWNLIDMSEMRNPVLA